MPQRLDKAFELGCPMRFFNRDRASGQGSMLGLFNEAEQLTDVGGAYGSNDDLVARHCDSMSSKLSRHRDITRISIRYNNYNLPACFLFLLCRNAAPLIDGF